MKKPCRKIALVIADLGPGGAQRVLIDLANAWTKQGFGVYLIVLHTTGKETIFAIEPLVRVISLNLGHWPTKSSFVMRLWRNVKKIARLRAQLKTLDPDTVISFIFATNVLTVLATRGLKAKLVISERNDPGNQSEGLFWDMARIFLYGLSDVVTANSNKALEHLSRYVQKSKLEYVPNPIRQFPAGANLDSTTPEPFFLTIGRLHEQKAHDILLKAFRDFSKNHPKWYLELVGEGSLERTLKSLAHSLELTEKIHFRGRIENPRRFYERASVFIMPSRHEGMPNALFEAISFGVPTIISDHCGMANEILEHRVSALIVPKDDVKALADAMAEIVQNKDLARVIARNAYEIGQEYSLNSVLAKWDLIL